LEVVVVGVGERTRWEGIDIELGQEGCWRGKEEEMGEREFMIESDSGLELSSAKAMKEDGDFLKGRRWFLLMTRGCMAAR
jgi:hypothetical protein